jgi:two-component system sensor histidine kinase DesK
MTRLKSLDRLRGRLYPDNPELGDLPVFLLGYLSFLAMPLFIGHSLTPWMVTGTLASLLVFLWLYFKSWWAPPARLKMLILALTALACATAQFNVGGNVYVTYAAAFCATLKAQREALRMLVLILCVFSFSMILRYDSMWSYLPPLIVSTVVFFSNRINTAQMREHQLLRLSHAEIAKLAQNDERSRIARELHDLLGHTLTVVALKAELARRLLAVDGEQAKRELVELEQVARASLAEVRAAVQGMRRAELPVELAKARLAFAAAGVALMEDIEPVNLPPELESGLASVLLEAVSNAVRHARASQALIRLRQGAKTVRLEVSDDGRGGLQENGHGLRGMRERIEQIGGRLELIDAKGVQVIVELPFEAPQKLPGAGTERLQLPALQWTHSEP